MYLYKNNQQNKKMVDRLCKTAHKFCRGVIDEDWILDACKKTGTIAVHYSNKRKIDSIVFYKIKRKRIHIELICAKRGVGRRLMNIVDLIGLATGCNVVQLQAIVGARRFYRKMGFIQSDNPCVKKPKIKIKKDTSDCYRYTKCIKGTKVEVRKRCFDCK